MDGFPIFFNTKQNQHYVGRHPEPNFYGVDFMGSKERSEFMAWYASKKYFRRDILNYCRSNVDILRQSCLQFRDLLMLYTGEQVEVIDAKGKAEMTWVGAVDPFNYVTIASVCINVYRTKFLEEWRIKLCTEVNWTPAKLTDGNVYVQRNSHWINEVDLGNSLVHRLQRSPPQEVTRTSTVKPQYNGWSGWCNKTE